MRIFVDNSGYGLCNMGDVAMLEVALQRLSDLFPSAHFDVLTVRPQNLAAIWPGARAVPGRGRTLFLANGTLAGQKLRQRFPHLEEKVRLGSPAIALKTITLKKRLLGRGGEVREMHEFKRMFDQADLVVCTGGGFINDAFGGHARCILELLHLGARAGKPTALLGQGIGPLEKPELRAQFGTWLPAINLVTLREARTGVPLLKELGYPQENTVVTGDDAVELAHGLAPAKLGAALGLNVRVAAYAGVEGDALAPMRTVFERAAQNFGTPLLPVPISRCSDGDDAQALLQLLPESPIEVGALQTPRAIIEQVGRCRVVVTGSYHAGVFALSQGVSVVALSNSAYYDDKFLGLAEQFGGGCEMVSLDKPDFPQTLQNAIDRAWQNAPAQRAALLEAAARQIQAGRAAYERLRTLI